jgi:hypothetical protein
VAVAAFSIMSPPRTGLLAQNNFLLGRDSARSSAQMLSDNGLILPNLQSHPMAAADLRRIALSLEGGGNTPTQECRLFA